MRLTLECDDKDAECVATLVKTLESAQHSIWFKQKRIKTILNSQEVVEYIKVAP